MDNDIVVGCRVIGFGSCCEIGKRGVTAIIRFELDMNTARILRAVCEVHPNEPVYDLIASNGRAGCAPRCALRRIPDDWDAQTTWDETQYDPSKQLALEE